MHYFSYLFFVVLFVHSALVMASDTTKPRSRSRSSADRVKISPATRVGDSIVLNCSGRTHSNNRKVFWETNKGRGGWNYVSSCEKARHCEDKQPKKTNTSMIVEKRKFTSSLKIHRTRATNRDHVYRCLVRDYTKDEPVVLDQYELNLYQLPKKLNNECKFSAASIPDPGSETDFAQSVNVSCEPMIFYPKVKCQLIQQWSLMNYPEIKSHKSVSFRYNYKRFWKGKLDYYNGSCSASFQLTFPGDYRFFLKVTPQIKLNRHKKDHQLVHPFSRSPQITVPRQGLRVMILKNSNRIFCPNRKGRHVLTCITSGYSDVSSMTLKWFVNSSLVTDDSYKNRAYNYVHRSQLFIWPPLLSANITCQVEDHINGKVQTDSFLSPHHSHIRASKKIPELAFVDQNGYDLGSSILISKDSGVTLQCVNKNVQSTSVPLRVVCQHTDKVVLQFEKAAKLTVQVQAFVEGYNKTDCYCLAKRGNKCYAVTATLRLRTSYILEKAGSDMVLSSKDLQDLQTQNQDNSYVLPAIIAMLILIVVVSIFFTFFVIKRCNQRDYCQVRGSQPNGRSIQRRSIESSLSMLPSGTPEAERGARGSQTENRTRSHSQYETRHRESCDGTSDIQNFYNIELNLRHQTEIKRVDSRHQTELKQIDTHHQTDLKETNLQHQTDLKQTITESQDHRNLEQTESPNYSNLEQTESPNYSNLEQTESPNYSNLEQTESPNYSNLEQTEFRDHSNLEQTECPKYSNLEQTEFRDQRNLEQTECQDQRNLEQTECQDQSNVEQTASQY